LRSPDNFVLGSIHISGYRVYQDLGQKVVVTDNRGIFDVTGLPPGEYSVELREEATRSVYRLDLRKVAVENITLFLDETRKPYD
jgi:hypothetical protein